MKSIYPALVFLLLLFSARPVSAREIHVALSGNDANDGSAAAPYRTISAAALVAQPGDTITVHAGVYRERVNPPRGGTSDTERITYHAAPGEKVEIAGSEAVNNWTHVQGDAWKVTLPNSFFGNFNPYRDVIHGDWFTPDKYPQHTGMVYLNGTWLDEAPALDAVLQSASSAPLWFAQVDAANTTIWARFPGVDPNTQRVEINVRQTVFYPEKTGLNYITVRGFTLRDAATPWAPPTAEQPGLIGPHWSKGWIIEDNIITHSRCAGISLGKYGDQWDNQSHNSAQGYVGTVQRAEQSGWNFATVGHHIVRHNTISYCDQDGIVGSLGAIGSLITGNHLFHIADRKNLHGAEMAAIKLHGAIDVVIQGNRIDHSLLAMWMDWMAQGTRITGNLCYLNGCDLMMEVDHGPFLIDDNILLSGTNLLDVSEGGAYVHNLWTGQLRSQPNARFTPYFPPHSTALAGLANIAGGDDRFFNNIFVGDGNPAHGIRVDSPKVIGSFGGFGLSIYNTRKFPLLTGGNVYYNAAQPYRGETNPVITPDNPHVQVMEQGDHVQLQFDFGSALSQAQAALVTTATLGKARVPNAAYENPDGSPLRLDTGYFGQERDAHPLPGPFAQINPGPQSFPVW